MMRLFLCQLLILFSLSSCVTLKEPEVRRVTNFNADGLLSGHPKISFDVVIYNPNSIGLSMTDFMLSVNQRNKSLATVKTSETYFAAPMAEAVIPLSIEPTAEQLSNLIQSGISGFGSGDLSGFTGTGSLKVKKFFLNKTFHFKF